MDVVKGVCTVTQTLLWEQPLGALMLHAESKLWGRVRGWRRVGQQMLCGGLVCVVVS